MPDDKKKDDVFHKSDAYLELMATGREDSIRILKSRMIDAVRRTYGANAIQVFSEERITVIIQDIWLNIDCQPEQFWIFASPTIAKKDVLLWNQVLTDFHSKIIEPLKDNIGGVYTRIG